MANYEVVCKEMGITHKDFFRTIENAIGDSELRIFSLGVSLQQQISKLEILLGPERERKIGLLRFPVTDVIFHFYDYSVDARKKTIKRFDLRFKRGGG